LAASADPRQQVYLVPAFTGLGAPHWDSEARAAIFGLTRGATRKEIVRAALESVGYQTRDLIDAMRADSQRLWGNEFASLIRIDGGMSASDWTMQFLADMLGVVDRPEILRRLLYAPLPGGLAGGSLPGDPRRLGGQASFSRRWQKANAILLSRPATPSRARLCDRRSRTMRIALAAILRLRMNCCPAVRAPAGLVAAMPRPPF
jgi:glycerol kinase